MRLVLLAVVASFSLAAVAITAGCGKKTEASETPDATASTQPAPAATPKAAQPSNSVTSAAVYVPDVSHSNEPLPDGVLEWNALLQTADATNEQEFARFTFSFTNVASVVQLGLATNVVTTTNFTTVTNAGFWASLLGHHIVRTASLSRTTNTVTVTNSITKIPVTVLNVHPSCGCTTAELPPVPWTIPPGGTGEMKFNVNLQGKNLPDRMASLFKQVTVTTDKGMKSLMLRINIAPPPPMPEMTEEQRAAGMRAAMADRQAVFKGDCASCHLKKIEGKYGQQLYQSVCAICHEAEHRASIVPDLHNLNVPTNEEFWRTWITAGKAGTLMPAFASSQGGPLNDLQVASIAAYLNAVIPSKAPKTNSPANPGETAR